MGNEMGNVSRAVHDNDRVAPLDSVFKRRRRRWRKLSMVSAELETDLNYSCTECYLDILLNSLITAPTKALVST